MGPQELNLSSEFIDGAESFGFPDIKAEMAYFRSYKSMEEVVEFVLFDDSHKAKFGGITIEQLPSNEFLVVDGEKKSKSLVKWTFMSNTISENDWKNLSNHHSSASLVLDPHMDLIPQTTLLDLSFGWMAKGSWWTHL